MVQGTVRWYDKQKGYGFLQPADGPDVFIHHTSLVNHETVLAEGDKVIFEVKDGEKGPKAENLSLLNK